MALSARLHVPAVPPCEMARGSHVLGCPSWRQVAGAKPETPTVLGLILTSYAMGILMFAQTIMLVEYGYKFMSPTFKESYDASMDAENAGKEMDKYLETAVFLQISNSSAILILSARTVGFFFTTMPAWQLGLSTAIGQVLINIWVAHPPSGIIAKMTTKDILAVWAYDVCWLLILDVVKMTAGFIWEKCKPKSIDENPALANLKRQSRRLSNNFQAGYTTAQKV